MATVPFKPSLPDIVSMSDISAAAGNVASFAHRTPVLTCETLSRMSGHRLFFKCENFQKSGAFKFRGAINALSYLSPDQLANGVVTHSSGNHAGALALAARMFGTTAHIVMPSNASRVKQAAVVEYGGRVVQCEPTLQSRLDVSATVQQATGATMIPPFNHRHVIAGQGTCAVEFLQQVPNLQYMVAPIGGGGLISGTCIATSATSEQCQVIGAEPAGADDAFRSKQRGELLENEAPDTIADGLLTNMGDLTWPYIRDVVAKIVTVKDQEIVEAMKLFLERTKVLIEPSSAVCLAAVMKLEMSRRDKPASIGIIISGGNVDLMKLPW